MLAPDFKGVTAMVTVTAAQALAEMLLPAMFGALAGMAFVHGFLWGGR